MKIATTIPNKHLTGRSTDSAYSYIRTLGSTNLLYISHPQKLRVWKLKHH